MYLYIPRKVLQRQKRHHSRKLQNLTVRPLPRLRRTTSSSTSTQGRTQGPHTGRHTGPIGTLYIYNIQATVWLIGSLYI